MKTLFRGIDMLGLLSMVAIPISLWAQPKDELFRLQQKYPEQPMVFTNVSEVINIDIIDGKPAISMKVDKESMMLDDKASWYADGGASYSSLVYLSGISAATLYPEAKRYREIPVNEFKEKDLLDGMIFHNDVKEKMFKYPQLVKGAKRKLTLTYDIKDPHLLTKYMLSEYFPVENTSLQISCPADVEIGYKIFNGEDVNIQYSTRKEKNRIIHEWKATDIKRDIDDAGGPNRLYYTPHIVYYIKSYTANGKTEKVLGSLDELHSYYTSLVKDVNQTAYAPLKNVTDSLTAGLTNETDKVKAVFYWVKDNIKYIAFESGFEGFIPRQAKDIYEKRYGDCKDMASIITDMLKYAGVKAYLTWIGSRDLPYSYTDNHTMSADNHMIATVKLNGECVFLDATSRQTPFGIPTGFIQGKEAIVHLADDKYEVVKVPEVANTVNVNNDSISVELGANNTLKGSGYAQYTGYERNNVLDLLNDKTRDEKLNILKSYFQKGSNKFILESFEEADGNNRDKPYKINYRFNLADYALDSGNEIFVNLNLDRLFEKSIIEKGRKLPLEFEHKAKFVNTVTLKIPDGYEVSYLPANDSLTNVFFGYKINYTTTEKTVTLKTEVYTNCLLLNIENFSAWNDFVNRLKKNYAESLSFRSKAAKN